MQKVNPEPKILVTKALLKYLGGDDEPLGRATIYRWLNQPELNFPKPLKLGPKKVAWLREEIDAWIMQRAGLREES